MEVLSKMFKVFLLTVDPDNGDLDDVITCAFLTRTSAEREKCNLIDGGCESILTVTELEMSDSWVFDENLNKFVKSED